MANNEIKTNAEIYREQRKARLAKAAKKKGSAKRDKIVRAIVKVIAIVLVVGVVFYGAAKVFTNIFCLPQKVLTAATYDDKKISVAEYNYYYMSLYNRIYSTASQYDSYYGTGYGAYLTGFDTSTDPAEQDYTADDAPEGVKTWADYFAAMAPATAFFYQEIYERATGEDAIGKGFTYDEEAMNTEIEDNMTQLQEYATSNDFSLDNFISRSCGEGLTEKSYRALLERDYIVAEYLTWIEEYSSDSVSEEDIKTYFNENKGDFTTVSGRVFAFPYSADATETDESTATYTAKDAKKLANEFLGKVTDEASFKATALEYCTEDEKEQYAEDSATLLDSQTKSALSSAESLANWLFDDARKVGDKAVVNDDSYYYVVYLTVLPTVDKSDAGVSVRHILKQAATTDDDGNDLDDATIEANFATAKKDAEAILKEWKAGDKTEESFAALATEKSDDTGSTETGGLYEDINASSSYVEAFKNWAIDPARKAGDVEIVKTEYGYHIMYFVSASNEEKWHYDVRTTIGSNEYTELVEGLYDEIEEKTEIKSFADFFIARTQETISGNFSSSTTTA